MYLGTRPTNLPTNQITSFPFYRTLSEEDLINLNNAGFPSTVMVNLVEGACNSQTVTPMSIRTPDSAAPSANAAVVVYPLG